MKSFKEAVFEVVKKIPRGQTISYKEVAKRAGRPLSWRAVGKILSKNYNPKIPCHRVICSDGRAGGYNEGGLRKIYLLNKEVVFLKNKANSVSTWRRRKSLQKDKNLVK